MAAAAAGLRGYAEFTSAFLDLGDRLLAEGPRLDAAFYYRAAKLSQSLATSVRPRPGDASSSWSPRSYRIVPSTRSEAEQARRCARRSLDAANSLYESQGSARE